MGLCLSDQDKKFKENSNDRKVSGIVNVPNSQYSILVTIHRIKIKADNIQYRIKGS